MTLADDTLLGREGLIATIGDRLDRTRLVTLVGPSGIGKTRAATEVARRRQAAYGNGAVVVDAAGLTDADALVRRMSAQLDALPAGSDVSGVTRVLADGDILVVVDDVVPGSPLACELAELIPRTAATWLVTAPRPLGAAGEHVVPVLPLSGNDGVDLLLSRARAAGADVVLDDSSAPLAARCVELLDGLPLAIELAAPSLVLGLDELAHRLERERAQGRYGVAISFATSLDQLDDVERRLLDTLVVAATPVDLELIASIDDPLLADAPRAAAALVRDGLVRHTIGPHGQAMFDLAGNVAAQAQDRLPAEHRDRYAQALVDACVETFAIEQYLFSQLRSADQARRWMALEPLGRRAIELARGLGRVEEYAALATAVHELTVDERGLNDEPLRAVWALADSRLSWERRTDLHLAMGVAALYLNAPDHNLANLDAALALAREHGDAGRIAMAQISRYVSAVADGRELPGLAEALEEAHSAAHASGRPGVLSSVFLLPSLVGGKDAVAGLQEGLRWARREGFPAAETMCLINLAEHLLMNGDPVAAERYALEGGALASELHLPYNARWSASLVQSARAIRGVETSLAAVATALLDAHETGNVRMATDVALKLGAGARQRGDDELAGDCLGLYQALLDDAGLEPVHGEEALIRSWLDGCVPIPPDVPLGEAVARVVTTFSERS